MADDERTNNTQASANQEQSREPVVDVEDIDVKKIETKRRDLHGWQWWIVAGIAISASAFHLYTALYGLLPAMYQRSIHWMLMGVLLYLLYPISEKRPKRTK